MRVLLSIKPEYADRILSGEKRFEFRKAVFKNSNVRTVVIYATMPVGKVVGEFEIDSILKESPSKLWRTTREYSGITKAFFETYFRGRKAGYAIGVKTATRYETPLELQAVIPGGVPPQSFRYLDAAA
ncbi:ASCH domain-containing protein [Burkholderia multivorans]|nr:ASCH domain-containing protein [Burkholderia multivorans]MDN8011627.1 ASCH domain-containing protein [Burkholderia multivorans]